MDKLIQSDLVEVRRVRTGGRGGRGVFARHLISEGTVLERVPVILIPQNQVFGESEVAIRACRISWYVFGWGKQDGHDYVALPLGYGAIYNHSYEPNATFQINRPDIMEFVAISYIKEGEEITINYNGDPTDKTPVRFPLAE
jgi:SET domain-containing protein